MRRPSLYILPLIFSATLFVGYPVLEYLFADYGLGKSIRDFRRPAIILFFEYFLLQFWLLGLVSGHPIYALWKALLIFNLAIVLPGSFAFPFSFVLFEYLFGISSLLPLESTVLLIIIFGLVIIFLLCWGGYRLLHSRLFSPFMDKGYGDSDIFLITATGFTMFINNIFILLSALLSS